MSYLYLVLVSLLAASFDFELFSRRRRVCRTIVPIVYFPKPALPAEQLGQLFYIGG